MVIEIMSNCQDFKKKRDTVNLTWKLYLFLLFYRNQREGLVLALRLFSFQILSLQCHFPNTRQVEVLIQEDMLMR
jgi:hypothetical protein